jgi:hypothetical protein
MMIVRHQTRVNTTPAPPHRGAGGWFNSAHKTNTSRQAHARMVCKPNDLNFNTAAAFADDTQMILLLTIVA